MRHLRQDSLKNCGQTCLAMLTRRSVRRVEWEMNKCAGTRFPDLRNYLWTTNWDVGVFERWSGRRWPTNPPVGGTALALCHRGRDRHWVVLHRGMVFDPFQAEEMSYAVWSHRTGFWVSSYAELTRPQRRSSRK